MMGWGERIPWTAMRTLIALILSMIVAAAMAGCDAPPSSPTVEPAPGGSPRTEAPSLPLPGSSVKPPRLSPTIEIPPPVD
jgi:hypothetical protein